MPVPVGSVSREGGVVLARLGEQAPVVARQVPAGEVAEGETELPRPIVAEGVARLAHHVATPVGELRRVDDRPRAAAGRVPSPGAVAGLATHAQLHEPWSVPPLEARRVATLAVLVPRLLGPVPVVPAPLGDRPRGAGHEQPPAPVDDVALQPVGPEGVHELALGKGRGGLEVGQHRRGVLPSVAGHPRVGGPEPLLVDFPVALPARGGPRVLVEHALLPHVEPLRGQDPPVVASQAQLAPVVGPPQVEGPVPPPPCHQRDEPLGQRRGHVRLVRLGGTVRIVARGAVDGPPLVEGEVVRDPGAGADVDRVEGGQVLVAVALEAQADHVEPQLPSP